MKKALALLAVVLTLGLTTVTMDAEAKRLGGGKSAGMQRQNTAPPANNSTAPTQQGTAAAAPAAGTAAAAAAAPAKRSWMGPLAGLAAGLGLAALASHLGFGEGLANMMMIGLLIMGVLMVVGFVMRKRAAGQTPAVAGNAGGMFRTEDRAPQTGFGGGNSGTGNGGSLIGSRIGSGLAGGIASGAAAGTQGNIPAGFDTAAFIRNAKDQFMALQKANDTGDLERLRDYLSPEMLEAARAELAERGTATQTTEVFGLEAQVLDVAEEADRYIVSVYFTGSIRDQHGAVPEDLNEIWHLTKPRAGMGGWTIAGIQQTQA